MAELKNMVLTLVFVLLVATAMMSMYSVSITNNVANGGGGVPDNNLNQTIWNYSSKLDTFKNTFTNATDAAGTAPVTDSSATAIGALSTAGAAAISVTWDSLGMMLGLLTTSANTVSFLGIPSYVLGYGLVFITLLMGFAILAAVFKWWI